MRPLEELLEKNSFFGWASPTEIYSIWMWDFLDRDQAHKLEVISYDGFLYSNKVCPFPININQGGRRADYPIPTRGPFTFASLDELPQVGVA